MDAPDLAPATRKRARPPADAHQAVPAPATEPIDAGVAARFAAVERALRTVDARLELMERIARSAGDDLRRELAAGFQEVASRALVLAEVTDEILTRHAQTLDRVEALLRELPDTVARTHAAGTAAVSSAITQQASALGHVEAALRSLRDASRGSMEATTTAMSEQTSALARVEVMLAALPDRLPRPDHSSLESAIAALGDGLISPLEAAVTATMDMKTAVHSLGDQVEAAQPTRAQLDFVAERLSVLLGGPTLAELMDRIDQVDQRFGDRPAEPPRKRRRGEQL